MTSLPSSLKPSMMDFCSESTADFTVMIQKMPMVMPKRDKSVLSKLLLNECTACKILSIIILLKNFNIAKGHTQRYIICCSIMGLNR